ncbi:MAG TPA: hypothetical protein VFV08_15825, partial [Puia sp.]|nr:hypothetical protein [Puia sp.]
ESSKFSGPVNELLIKTVNNDKPITVQGIVLPSFLPSIHIPELTDHDVRCLPYKFNWWNQLPGRIMSPDILLGIHHLGHLQITFREKLPYGYTIFDSVVGPFICGKNTELLQENLNDYFSGYATPAITQSSSINHEVESEEREDIKDTVARYFNYSSAGFLDDNSLPKDDELVHEEFLQNIK